MLRALQSKSLIALFGGNGIISALDGKLLLKELNVFYDTKNNLPGELDYLWNSTTCVPSYQPLFSYDASSFEKGYSIIYWNSAGIKKNMVVVAPIIIILY